MLNKYCLAASSASSKIPFSFNDASAKEPELSIVIFFEFNFDSAFSNFCSNSSILLACDAIIADYGRKSDMHLSENV